MIKRFLFTLMLLLNYGCSDARQPLSLSMLQNSEYKGIYEKQIKLIDGKYEAQSFVKSGISRESVTLLNSFTRFGDLNGDGLKDAVVLLSENSGGSGTFIYLAVVVNKNAKAVNVATQFLEDRAKIESVSIESGEVILHLVTHAKNDPMCCPSKKETRKYFLKNGSLIQR